MNKLHKTVFLFIFLVLNALSAQQEESPLVEHWEIVTQIYIGVQTEKLTDEERAGYGLPKMEGLRIKRVIPGSPAEKSGLMAGDIITLTSGGATASMEDLLRHVRNISPGGIVHFGILRDGVERVVPVRTEALPEPVVVAHATLAVKTPPNQEAMAGNQRRIAELLAADTPDLQALHAEFRTIDALFPEYGKPGQIRLYYKTDFGYLTVTDFPDGLLVTVQREQSSENYRLRKQGDKLPPHVAGLFAKMK